MKILSIDVGIRNLSFCLFTMDNKDKNTLSVLKWDNIDLTEKSSNRCIFVGEKKTEGVCDKEAKFVKDGVSADELADAKRGWQEERKISRAQDRALAAGHVAQTAANRTLSFAEQIDAQIESTTLAQVNAAIRQSLEPVKFLNVYAGDFAPRAKK